MQTEVLFVSGRCASVRLNDGGLYYTKRSYRLTLNGADAGGTQRVVTTVYGLMPGRTYTLGVWAEEKRLCEVRFETPQERCTLDVRRFGAKGDGGTDDTAALQAAILSCPPQGRVWIPEGVYCTGPLFLKSHIRLEIGRGAKLLLHTDRRRFPILPGMTQGTGEQGEYNLGTWEGEPQDMFASLLTGVDVEDVHIYGEGMLDGRAEQSDWWRYDRVKKGAFRGRMLYLCRCREVCVLGLCVRNSPAWNLHPYFSESIRLLDLKILAPKDSPNTDGINPESCRRVRIAGVHFSLGDDCIAIKSGKRYMGMTYRTPCEEIEVMHCLMERGHGGVTIGSEMAGGVRNVWVHDCRMRDTDRGLRIKTMRGRGSQGVVDDIRLQRVCMERIGAPFVVNAMYYCDPDGFTAYVQSREKQAVDERTPEIGRIEMQDVEAADCYACAAYFLGLPEKPIREIQLKRVRFALARETKPMEPVMAVGVEACHHRGIVAKNVRRLLCEDVELDGVEGERMDAHDVDELTEAGKR